MRRKTNYDAIVIGAGLTGACAAKELGCSGLKVAVLDAGPVLPPEVFADRPFSPPPTALSRQLYRLGLLARGEFKKAMNAPLQQETHSYFLSQREHPYDVVGDPFSWSRVHAVGGRGHFWGRVLLRFTPEEFKENWPLTAGELHDYYSEVEKAFMLGGRPSNTELVPDGAYQAQRELSQYERMFCEEALERLPGRAAVVNHVAEYEPGALNPMLRMALESGNVELHPQVVVLAVEPRGKHDADVLIYDKTTRQKSRLHTSVVCMAASALETCRILLESRSENHPAGLGNNSDNLGRTVLEHLFVGDYTTVPPLRTSEAAVPFSPFWLNREPTGFYLPPARSGPQYGVQGVISDVTGTAYIGAFGRLSRNRANRIRLHDRQVDQLGRPRPVVHFRASTEDRALYKRMNEDVSALSQAFFGRIGQRRSVPLTVRLKQLIASDRLVIGSNHESGGAAMGSDPRASVVTPEGCLWDAENILVCDSACFPSLPPQNPTLTAMALGLRTARLAVRRS